MSTVFLWIGIVTCFLGGSGVLLIVGLLVAASKKTPCQNCIAQHPASCHVCPHGGRR